MMKLSALIGRLLELEEFYGNTSVELETETAGNLRITAPVDCVEATTRRKGRVTVVLKGLEMW